MYSCAQQLKFSNLVCYFESLDQNKLYNNEVNFFNIVPNLLSSVVTSECKAVQLWRPQRESMKELLEQSSTLKASRQAKDLLRIRLEEKGEFGKRKDKEKLEEGQA